MFLRFSRSWGLEPISRVGVSGRRGFGTEWPGPRDSLYSGPHRCSRRAYGQHPFSGGPHVKELMTTEQLLQGLKHYRRIARQDMLRASETPHPDAFLQHAESRREVYVALGTHAETHAADEVIAHALELYRGLPFVTGTAEHEHAQVKGRENALENFFLLVGLDPKTRREARSKRPRLDAAPPPGPA